jgi:hypothetical protein
MSDPLDHDDGLPPEGSDPLSESPEARAARTRRNWLLAGALLAFVALVFIVTIIRLGGHVFE